MDLLIDVRFYIGTTLIFLFYFTKGSIRVLSMTLFIAELIYLYMSESILFWYLIGVFIFSLHFAVRGWHRFVIALVFATYIFFLWSYGFFTYRYDTSDTPKTIAEYSHKNAEKLFSFGGNKEFEQ